MKLWDTMTNLAANLGAGRSKLAGDRFVIPQLPDAQLEAMYRGDWMARKIVDKPVKDIMRAWREWQAEGPTIEAMEEAEKRHQVKEKIALAWIMARIYGGSAILIGADVAEPMAPLNLDRVGKGGLGYLTVLPRRVIHAGDVDRDPASPYYGKPAYYRIGSSVGGSIDLHPSRIIPFIGAPRPDIDLNVDGWGDSLLQVIYDAIHNAALTSTGIAELVHEAKLDVIKIPNLGAMLSTEQGTNAITKRFSASNALKSINNTLILDAGEEWDRKQTAFSALPDVLTSFLQIVAGAADMPVTVLLGTAPKGLNATGEGDQRNYYDMLDGVRHEILCPVLDRLDDLLWVDATGSRKPKDAYWEFAPLWQVTATEKAALAKTYAETAKIYTDMAIMPEEALAQGIVNQLIESGVYPGLEAAITEWVQAGRALVPEPEETDPNAVRPASNGPRRTAQTGDRIAPRPALPSPRDRFERDAQELGAVYNYVEPRQRH